MKALTAVVLSISSLTAWSMDRGINYDPAHSPGFTKAQSELNISQMQQIMQHDVHAIQKAGFTAIKTFYSNFATIDGKKSFNAADVICPLHLKLYLGVYEFNPDSDKCSTWCEAATETQVQKAIQSANKYPDCIEMVLVGNEDIYNWNFTQPNSNMQRRIVSDIDKVKQGINNKTIVVTSAQQDGAWLKLSKADPYGILGKIDTIAVNIYPYWSAQHPNVEAAKPEFMNRYQAIKNTFPGKKVAVTEEGWPSQYNKGQNPNGTLEQAKAYYHWWQSRAGSDDFISMYFTMFDKQPTNADADKYFGLCSYQNQPKVIDQCQ